MDKKAAFILALISLTSGVLAQVCNENSYCSPSFVCSNGYCMCPYDGQIVQNNSCLIPAGGKCDVTWKCVDGATCDGTETCECNSDRQEQDYTGLCLHHKDGPCETTADCVPNVGLECSTDGICSCTNFGIPGACFKGNGSLCTATSECTQANGNYELKCVSKICSCPWGKVYKANKAKYVPDSAYSYGDCKIPYNRRCSAPGTNQQCITGLCGANYRCGCGTGATYDTTNEVCACQNGEVYSTVFERCICLGINYGSSTCECPGDFVPDANSWMCRCPDNSMLVSDNTCTCAAPAEFNSTTKACEFTY